MADNRNDSNSLMGVVVGVLLVVIVGVLVFSMRGNDDAPAASATDSMRVDLPDMNVQTPPPAPEPAPAMPPAAVPAVSPEPSPEPEPMAPAPAAPAVN